MSFYLSKTSLIYFFILVFCVQVYCEVFHIALIYIARCIKLYLIVLFWVYFGPSGRVRITYYYISEEEEDKAEVWIKVCVTALCDSLWLRTKIFIFPHISWLRRTGCLFVLYAYYLKIIFGLLMRWFLYIISPINHRYFRSLSRKKTELL